MKLLLMIKKKIYKFQFNNINFKKMQVKPIKAEVQIFLE